MYLPTRLLRPAALPLLLLSLLSAGAAHAQTPGSTDQHRFRVSGGMGVSTQDLSASVFVALPAGEGLLLSGRGAITNEFELFVTPNEHTWDVGVLGGRLIGGEHGYAAVSAGLAIVGGVRRGRALEPEEDCWFFCGQRYEADRFLAAGVPLDIQVFWTPLSLLGVGLHGFANLNPERSFAGLAVHLQVSRRF